MITDMRVIELGDAVLIDVPAVLAEAVRAHLDRFVFSEDVQVQDVTAERAVAGLYGPEAAATASRVLQPEIDLASLPLFGNVRLRYADRDVLVVRSDEPGVEGYDFVLDSGDAAPLPAAFRAAGAIDVNPEAAEVVRVEVGDRASAPISTKRRFRSKRASRIARSHERRAVTWGRRSSCASWIGGEVGSPVTSWGSDWHPTCRAAAPSPRETATSDG